MDQLFIIFNYQREDIGICNHMLRLPALKQKQEKKEKKKFGRDANKYRYIWFVLCCLKDVAVLRLVPASRMGLKSVIYAVLCLTAGAWQAQGRAEESLRPTLPHNILLRMKYIPDPE